jgi:succinate dehydrogenase/fumarate reductase flavoprotein subunit
MDHRDSLHMDTDVLVVGGGAAGVAAAVTAARECKSGCVRRVRSPALARLPTRTW